MRKFRRLVVRAKQSPLSALQWLITFACGHEVWHTQKTRPHGYKVCAVCRAYDVIAQARVSMPELKDCTHERLNEDGICRACGADRRGI